MAVADQVQASVVEMHGIGIYIPLGRLLISRLVLKTQSFPVLNSTVDDLNEFPIRPILLLRWNAGKKSTPQLQHSSKEGLGYVGADLIEKRL